MLLVLTLLAAALLLLNFPIFAVLLLSSLVALAATSSVPFDIVIQTLFGSIDKFALMAIPFFIFAASVMDRGGMSRRLIGWVEALFSSFKGGLGLTTVASCEVFGCISGSSPATVVAVGSLLFPALVKNGYGRAFSLGLVTASGAIAILIPPSIAMIILSISLPESPLSIERRRKAAEERKSRIAYLPPTAGKPDKRTRRLLLRARQRGINEQ